MANKPYFDRYIDARGYWRWRFITGNGRIIADSGEGYNSLDACDHAIGVLQREAPLAALR
jgi:uncharacterized protein